jgi:4-amino-4-deoxy-L-arabinose transferase-like glycosyltransferase
VEARLAASSQAGRRGRAGAWWLLALIPLFLLGQRHGLWGADEPREAEIAREMYVSSDWVVPRLDGRPFLEKPPLTHWAAAVVFHVIGGASAEWCRVPSALWGMLGSVACFWLGSMLFGRRVGVLAAFVLATSQEWLLDTHTLLADAPLAAGVVWSLALFWYGYTSGSRGQGHVAHFLAAGATGVAFLAKGPIGLVLPAAGILVFLAWRKELREAFRLVNPANVTVFAALAVPWLLLLRLRAGDTVFHTFFWDNMVLRVFSASADHAAPPWYYALAVFGVMVPWALFIPPVVYGLARPGKSVVEGRQRSWQFLVSIIAGPLVLLSLASAKRPSYLLPLMPAFAVAIAAWLDGALQEREGRWTRIWRVAGVWVLGAVAVAVWAFSGYLALQQGVDLWWSFLGLAVSALGVAALGCAGRRRAARRVPAVAAGLALLTSLSLVSPSTFHAIDARRGYRTLTAALDNVAVPGTRFYGYGMGERELGVVCFHLRETIPQVGGAEGLRRILLDPENVVLVNKLLMEQQRADGTWPEMAAVVAEPPMRLRHFVLVRRALE